MSSYRVISGDSHIYEPSDLWADRAEPKFKDRLPHVEPAEPGAVDLNGRPQKDSWICEGQFLMQFGGDPKTGVRFDDPAGLLAEPRSEDAMLKGAFIPEEHVKDNELDGIDVSIVYPTLGCYLFGVQDGLLLDSIFRSYNDWVAEWCDTIPDKLKGIAMINNDDVGVAVKEMERCRKMGLIGAMITVSPLDTQLYDQPVYEPMWAASQDLDMPLSLHAATNRVGFFSSPLNLRPAYVTCMHHWIETSLADIILSGVLDRYPKIKIGSVEHELAWAPHFIDRLDNTYTQRVGPWLTENRLKDDLLPSDQFRTNCFLGFQEDALGLKDRDIIGVNTLQWGSDYPHLESTFPRSREILDGMMIGCTDEEKAKIVGGNCAEMYHI